MDSTTFRRIRERLASGINHDTIYMMLEAAAIATHARSAALVEQMDDGAEIIMAYGLSLVGEHVLRPGSPLFRPLMDPSSSSDAQSGFHAIRVPLRRLGGTHRLAVVCWNIRPDHAPTDHAIGIVEHLGTGISQQLNMLGEVLGSNNYVGGIYQAAETVAAYVAEEGPDAAAGAEGGSVVSQFLLNTLVKKRRLLTRDEITYHSIRSWRTSMKEWQIASLRAIKQAPPQALVRAIAEELGEEAKRVVGADVVRTVAAVPCGHSGPQCLASRVARTLAEILGASHAELFETLPVKGKSHPKENVKRPPMRMTGKAEGPVLLVDDVATSGSHIVEAVRHIRSGGNVVVPIVWISSGSE